MFIIIMYYKHQNSFTPKKLMILSFQTLPALIPFGLYFCKINFLCGFFPFFQADLKPATINILRPARNVYVINETSRLVFLCEADGYPPPNVSWLQNGKNLSGQHYEVRQNERGLSNRRSLLIIERTKYPRDNGTYTCKAKNIGVSQKSVEISIQSKCNDNNNDKIFLW